MHNNLSDSGKIELADDDSCFEPTDGADDKPDNNNDVDNNDEGGGKIDSYVSAKSHDSDLDNDPLASPEEARHGAREATEESRRSAQEGAVNPLRTSDREEHGTPPPTTGKS